MIWEYNLMRNNKYGKSITVRSGYAYRNVWYRKLGRKIGDNHLPLAMGFILMIWSFIAGFNVMAWLVS